MSKQKRGRGFLERAGLVERVYDRTEEQDRIQEDYSEEYLNGPPETSIYGDEEVTGQDYKKSGDNFILKVYRENDLSDLGDRSIFKIEQLRATLPDTLPKDVQRESVKKMLAAFGLDQTTLTEDGDTRISVLNQDLKDYIASKASEINEMESNIEDAKALIQKLESSIKEAREETKAVELAVADQTNRIQELCRFIDPPMPREEA